MSLKWVKSTFPTLFYASYFLFYKSSDYDNQLLENKLSKYTVNLKTQDCISFTLHSLAPVPRANWMAFAHSFLYSINVYQAPAPCQLLCWGQRSEQSKNALMEGGQQTTKSTKRPSKLMLWGWSWKKWTEGLWPGGESKSFSWDHQEPSLPSPASMLPQLPVVVLGIKFTFPVGSGPGLPLWHHHSIIYLLELSSWRSSMEVLSPGSSLTSHPLAEWCEGAVPRRCAGAGAPSPPRLSFRFPQRGGSGSGGYNMALRAASTGPAPVALWGKNCHQQKEVCEHLFGGCSGFWFTPVSFPSPLTPKMRDDSMRAVAPEVFPGPAAAPWLGNVLEMYISSLSSDLVHQPSVF